MGLAALILYFDSAYSHRMKAYIIYRIALCIHLEVYILLTILILDEIIRAELVVFLGRRSCVPLARSC